jgi:UDP-N-acetylmuramyl pentapeptide phosphotransferase/UDP-N-acetylglucosamine-1-phosphate transferase
MISTIEILFLLILSTAGLYGIRVVSFKRKWFDIPTERSSHEKIVPRTAGIVIATLSLFSILFMSGSGFDTYTVYVIYAAFLFVGIYDDIYEVRASYKFWLQLIAALAITTLEPGLRVNDFHGFLGIGHIDVIPSILFTSFVIIVIMNAYNLIDGVDGLAASFSIIGVYLLTKPLEYTNPYIAKFGQVIVTVIIPFYFFNFSKSRKMFLGDTGSLFLGLSIAIFTCYFLNNNHPIVVPADGNRAMYVMVALCYPLLDTLRVFAIRLSRGQSPFTADRNHIHHKLLGFGLKHWQTTAALVTFNILILWVNYRVFKDINPNAALLGNLILIGLCFLIGQRYNQWQKQQNKA